MFSTNAGEIADCWKAATSRGAKETSLEVSITIDPFGGTRDPSARSERAADDALAACVQGALSTVTFTGTTTRPLRVGATLQFVLSQQPAWSRPFTAGAPRPDPDLRDGTVCTPVLDDGVIGEMHLPAPLVVTDWDSSREPPRRGTAAPYIMMGCALSFVDTDKHAVREAIRSNYGALQACYADALQRDPTLTGNVELTTDFGGNGTPLNTKVTRGVGDPALHACLVTAVQEMWVVPAPRPSGGLEVNLTFTLQPPTAPAPSADDPVALLAAGDADGALAAWTAKLNTPISAELACRGRAGVLLAIAELSPWLDDARVRAAIQDLATAAGALSLPAARACVATVAPVIADLTRARGQPAYGERLTHLWLERYAAALPLAPYLDDGAALRWFYAEALRNTTRAAEATELLKKLAWDPTIGLAVTEQIQKRSERVETISDTCGD